MPSGRRGTRGKGRKISYWDDKAVVPAKTCPKCNEEIYKGRCNCDTIRTVQ